MKIRTILMGGFLSWVILTGETVFALSGPPSAEQIQQMMQQYQGSGMPTNIPTGVPSWAEFDPSAMQQQGEAQWLIQMRAGIATFKSSMERVKAQIRQFESQWGRASESLKDAMNKVDVTVKMINEATSIAQAQKGFDMIESITSVIDTELPKAAMSAQLPNLLKRAENELSKFIAQFNTIKTKTRLGDFDTTQAIGEINTRAQELQSALDNAKKTAEDNPAKAIEDIQVNLFDKLQSTWQLYGGFQAMGHLQDASVMIIKTARMSDTILKKAELEKLDTTELKKLDTELKAKIEEFVGKIRTKVDVNEVENIMKTIGEIMDIKSRFDSEVERLGMDIKTVNPLEWYMPVNSFQSTAKDMGQMALSGSISTQDKRDSYAPTLERNKTQIDTAIIGLEKNLNRKFGNDTSKKTVFLENIIKKIDTVLAKSNLSEKNRAIYSLLLEKVRILQSSYETGDVTYDDVLNEDISKLLEVQ